MQGKPNSTPSLRNSRACAKTLPLPARIPPRPPSPRPRTSSSPSPPLRTGPSVPSAANPATPSTNANPSLPNKSLTSRSTLSEVCPCCGGPVHRNADLARIVQQVDVEKPPLTIEQHTFPEYWCPQCRKPVRAAAAAAHRSRRLGRQGIDRLDRLHERCLSCLLLDRPHLSP